MNWALLHRNPAQKTFGVQNNPHYISKPQTYTEVTPKTSDPTHEELDGLID